jgi:DNA-directed RNA polymerase specialized sigma24 family protein
LTVWSAVLSTWNGRGDAVIVDLEELYARQQAPMTRLARAIVGSNGVAEELVHDAFVRVARRGIGDLRDPEAYLRTTVIHLSRSWVARRHAPEPPRSLGEPHIDETWAAVQRLPQKYREVLALRYYADLPEAEIASILGAKPATIRSRIHRGLTKLKEELS